MKISVTRALTRIKTIGEQLENISLFKSPLVFATLEKWKDTPQVKEKTSQSQSEFDKFNNLHKELISLQVAVQKSNLEIKVKIGSEELTVTEVLVRKNNINRKLEFYKAICEQSAKANQDVLRSESRIEDTARKFAESAVKDTGTSDGKIQLEQALAVGRASAINEFRLVVKSGFDTEKAKSELEEIEKFIEEIDYVLSESNATTIIEVEV